MARSAPRLGPRIVLGRSKSGGVPAYFEDHGASSYAFYGYGKVATRDGIDVLLAERPDATNVVLPAYLPYGMVEPFREAGLEPRFYGCDHGLAPDLDAIEDHLDRNSLAAMYVHYFGRPRSSTEIEVIEERCREYGAFTIEDNAHSALSTLDGQLLGTTGDIGLTSIRKTMPIPNGAALFLGNDELPEDRLTRSVVRDRYTRSDYRFCARSFGGSMSGRPGFDQALSVLRWANDHRPHKTNGHVHKSDLQENPQEVYESTKVPMSRLSMHVLDRIDPLDVIADRRANYRSWDRAIRDLDGVEPVFDSLTDGTCPQYYPAIVEDPSDLGALSEAAKPWPPLPHDIRGAEAFEAENYLSEHLHTLPVHQGLDLRGLDDLAAGR